MRLALEWEPRSPAELIRGIGAALEALTVIDVGELGGAHRLPGLYDGVIRYEAERARNTRLAGVVFQNPEHWRAARIVAREGHGDCEDLCAYRAAELRRAGEGARAIPALVGTRSDGRRQVHVFVLRADGAIEDPSLDLGMRAYHFDPVPSVEEALRWLDR